MKIAIFGLGYAGTICGTCLAGHGHSVVGVDVQQSKVDLINQAQSPVIEPGLQALLAEAVESGNLSATTDTRAALTGAEVAIICVGTPPGKDGSLNLSYLESVTSEIAANLDVTADYPVIAIRSTVPPGTIQRCRDILTAAAEGNGEAKECAVVGNPEFLREGSAIKDFENAPYTLVGTDDKRAAEIMKKVYSGVNAPFINTTVGVAEIIKYVNNSFHALKIAFSNEIGLICKANGIDSHDVMDIVCQDTKLNISSAYMKPGFAYGGSCLPKDLEALNQLGRGFGLESPVLGSIEKSNSLHLERSVSTIEETGNRRIGFLGLSFKADTDDLRESPSVKIVQKLLDRGYEIRVFDPNINIARLVGANRAYIDEHISDVARLLVGSMEEIITFADTIVVTNNDPAYHSIMKQAKDDQIVVDLARLPGSLRTSEGRYCGICW